MWGAVGALILPEGWASQPSWCLMDGTAVHRTAAQALAARGGGGSYALPPLGPTPMPAVSRNGDAWRRKGETSAEMLARAVANQREWALLQAGRAAAAAAGSGSSRLSTAVMVPAPRVAIQQPLRFAAAAGSSSSCLSAAVMVPVASQQPLRFARLEGEQLPPQAQRFWPPQQAPRMPSPSFAGFTGFAGSDERDDDDDERDDDDDDDDGDDGDGGGGGGGGGGGCGGGGMPPPPERRICRYGAGCYQKNTWHFANFDHPVAPDATASARAATPVPPRGMGPAPRSPTPVGGTARVPPAKKPTKSIPVSDEDSDD